MNNPEQSRAFTASPSEAEETLRAIREGEVDALVVRRAKGEEIFSLHGWDDSYRAFMEIMDHGAAALGVADELLYANDIFCRFMGKPLSELQGIALLDNLPTAHQRDIADLLERARGGKQTLEIAVEHEDGDRFFLMSAMPFEMGVISGLALTLTDLTERVLEERSLASERSARAIIASANEAVVVCDMQGRITHVNAAVCAIQEGELVGELFHDAIKLVFPSGSSVAEPADLVSMAVDGPLKGIEAHAPDAPRVKDLLISAAPLTLAGEAIGGCVITMTDISQRKVAERQQTLVMQELDHRVKNTLTLVLSIARRTADSEDTVEGYHKAFSGRIHALAATHDLLAKASSVGLTLADLVASELTPYVSPDSGRVYLEGLAIGVNARAAVPIRLILHELVTNAVKYGALSTDAGEIRLQAKDNPEQGYLELEWVETGGPPVVEPERNGFGRTVITRVLKYSPKGAADLDFHPEGVKCTMRIPREDISDT